MINEKDKNILSILEKDAKLSMRKIAAKVKLPVTTIHNRIKKMESLGIIEGYVVKLNKKKLGKNVLSV